METVMKLLAARADALEREGAGSCPSAAGLVGAAWGRPPNGFGYSQLAGHILVCAQCAVRWQRLQEDADVTLSELYALLRGAADGEFARLRAEDHIRRCQGCRRIHRQVTGLVRLGGDVGRSIRLSRLGERLRHQLAEPALVLRTASEMQDETIEATVTDAKERPQVLSGQVVRRSVKVSRAEFDAGGRLGIELQIPSGCTAVRLAVKGGEQWVMLPEARPHGGLVRFMVETELCGQAVQIPAASLAVWVTVG